MWQDDGVKLLLDISTGGQFITPPTRVSYPFVANGQIPMDWAKYFQTGGDILQATWSMSGDVQTVQSSATNSNLALVYGINRTFSVTPGHRYQISVEVRGDAVKYAASAPTLSVGFIKVGDSSSSSIRQNNRFQNGMPDNEWHTLNIDYPMIVGGVNVDRIDVALYSRTPSGSTQPWGVQWRNFTLTDVTAVSAPSFTWRAVECDGMDASIRYGRARFTERYDVATSQVMLNNVSGEYTYQDPHPWGFRPGRMFRLRAQYKGTTYPLVFGVIDRIKTVMTINGKANVTLTVFDTTSYCSDVPTPSIWFMNPGTINDPDAKSGNRVNALLNTVGYAASMRVIDAGIFGMQNVNESGRGIREEIGVTADSEGGSFFGERDGRVIYRDRSWASRDPRGGTVQANFTAVPGDMIIDLQPDDVPTDPNAPVICPATMDTDWSMERVINLITLAVVGGTKQYFSNVPSQSENGIRTYQRFDFLNYGSTDSSLGGSVNTQLAARANDIFSTSLKALLRVQRLSYRPRDGQWAWTFTVFLDWLVRVFYYIRDGTWGFATVVRVQSIEHRISPTDWLVTIDVDQPISFTDELHPGEPGGWDADEWDEDVWDQPVGAGGFWSSHQRWNDGTRWGK